MIHQALGCLDSTGFMTLCRVERQECQPAADAFDISNYPSDSELGAMETTGDEGDATVFEETGPAQCAAKGATKSPESDLPSCQRQGQV